MSTKDEQKKQWKKDADQLKQDLDNRPKKVVRREVNISLGGKKQEKPQSSSTPKKSGSPMSDEIMRKKLGL